MATEIRSARKHICSQFDTRCITQIFLSCTLRIDTGVPLFILVSVNVQDLDTSPAWLDLRLRDANLKEKEKNMK